MNGAGGRSPGPSLMEVNAMFEKLLEEMLEPLVKEKAKELFDDLRNSLRSHDIDLDFEDLGGGSYKICIYVHPKPRHDELYELAQGGTD